MQLRIVVCVNLRLGSSEEICRFSLFLSHGSTVMQGVSTVHHLFGPCSIVAVALCLHLTLNGVQFLASLLCRDTIAQSQRCITSV